MKIPAVKIRGLKKSFNKVQALNGVDLTIKPGEFLGLLGPNGAGKTTTINILTGLVIRQEGLTEIFGKDTVKDYRFTRSKIGIAAQELSIDWFFPIEKLLLFHAGYYGLPISQAKERVDIIIEKLGLGEKKNTRLRQLSGGMKRRYQLAKALIHDPEIIILDEPTAGVDVELRHELWDYLRQLHSEGKTILLTTHYIEEAELLCERVAIINKGKIIKEGSPKELTMQLGQSGLSVHLSGWGDSKKEILDDFTFTYDDGRLHFSLLDPEKDMATIIKILTKNDCHIQSVSADKASLEDVFLDLTGEKIN
ncbi:MAG: ABC transporter ATP-binding protein [Candidatus Neomarinimicrobiota bacterium]|nr:ABC transporter ATP-binding protein [Candidatus Neomarinimicrobiota bacterium]